MIKYLLYFYSIHPRTKHDVAYRLSRSGLAVAYNRSIEFQGPIVSNISVSSDRERIYVTYTAVSDITFRNLNGFEVFILISLVFINIIFRIFRSVVKV